MHVPDGLRYSPITSGSAVDGDRIRVGITDYAQDAFGDVVFVDLPEIEGAGRSRGVLGEVESTKSVSEIYAPVAGEVVAVNDASGRSPEQLNADPTERDGSARSSPIRPDAVEGLLDAERLPELIAG
jgi:glycine cleavage system H protein